MDISNIFVLAVCFVAFSPLLNLYVQSTPTTSCHFNVTRLEIKEGDCVGHMPVWNCVGTCGSSVAVPKIYFSRSDLPHVLPDGTSSEYPYNQDCQCCTTVFEFGPRERDVKLVCQNETEVYKRVVGKIASGCACTQCDET